MVEVAHDYQAQVQKYIIEELGLLNSYDMWHGKYKSTKVIHTKIYSWSGTKSVAKLTAKITKGAARSEGVTRFHQLSDKPRACRLLKEKRACNSNSVLYTQQNSNQTVVCN